MWKRTAVLLFLSPNLLLAANTEPKTGTYYTLNEVGIKKKELKGTQLHLTFKPKDEQFHWCPGIKVQVTKKATIVTFVRCKTSKDCGIDKKATIGKRLIRTVTIDTKGMDTYVLNGPKKYKRIHQAPKGTSKSKGPKAKKQTSSAQSNRVLVTNPFSKNRN